MLALPCMLVCSFACANRTRDRGCSKHPVFPAPSKFWRANEDANLGRSAPREHEGMSIVGWVERSETHHLSAPSASALMGYRFAPPILRDCMTRRDLARTPRRARLPPARRTGLPTKQAGNPSRQNVAFLQCNKTINTAPANGQWQFDPLLCIGAAGIQASEPSCRALQK